jgi:hypothetical protein
MGLWFISWRTLKWGESVLGTTVNLYNLMCDRGGAVYSVNAPVYLCLYIMDELTIKTLNPICRLFFKIDLLTDIAALCLTDFIDWRYIHSLVCIFDPACELLPPWTKELYLCTVAPLSSLWPPPPPFPNKMYSIQYTDSVCLGGGVNCAVDHILQEMYTLFLTRFKTYQIASPPQTKWPLKTTLRGWCL